MYHSFDVEIAKICGVNGAVIFNHIAFWIAKNKANNECHVDGRFWTYSTVSALVELFPYLSTQTIRTTIKHLVDQDLIMTGQHGGSSRATWFALTDRGEQLIDNPKVDILPESTFVKTNKSIVETNKCINDISKDNKERTPIRGKKERPTLDEVKAYCQEANIMVDPEYFFRYYEATNWMSKNEPIRNWKLKLITWDKVERQRANKPKETGTEFFD